MKMIEIIGKNQAIMSKIVDAATELSLGADKVHDVDLFLLIQGWQRLGIELADTLKMKQIEEIEEPSPQPPP